MSSIRNDLQIRVVIAGAQPERLNAYLASIKQAADVNIRQYRAMGDLRRAYEEATKTALVFGNAGKSAAAGIYNAQAITFLRQLNTEFAKLNQSPANVADKIEAGVVRSARATAQLARETGDYNRALGVLKTSLGQVRNESEAWYKIQTDIARVQRQQAGATAGPTTAQVEAQLARRAAMEARLARSAGDYVGEQRILNDALAKFDVNGEAAIATQTRLNNAMQAANAAAERQTRGMLAAENAVARRAISEARLARASGDFAREQSILTSAMTRVNATSEAAVRLNTRLASSQQAESRAADAAVRAVERQARAAERLNDANARRIILEARVASSTGDQRGALQILQGGLGTLVPNSNAALRVQSSINQTQASLDSQPGLLSRISGGLNSVFTGLTRTVAVTFLWMYALRQVGSVFDTFILSPVNKTLAAVLKTTDEFRRLEITFSGILGSRSAAVSLSRDVGVAGAGLPSTLLEQLNAIRALAYTPFTASSIQNPAGRQQRLGSLLQTLQGLAIINPDPGVGGFPGAEFAVREALAGQFRSLRTRFNISPEVVANSIGRTQSDLRADPALVLPALEAFVKSFVGPDTIRELSGLLSIQGKLFRGNIDEFLKLIGDQGIYDRVTGIVRGFNDRLSAGIRGRDPEVLEAATQISLAFERLIDSMLEGASAVLSALTGKDVDLKEALDTADIGKLATIVGDVISALTRLAASLYLVISDIATAGAHLLNKLGIGGPQTAAETSAQLAILNGTSRQQGSVAGAQAVLDDVSEFHKKRQQTWLGRLGGLDSGGDVEEARKELERLTQERTKLERRLAIQTAIESGATGDELISRLTGVSSPRPTPTRPNDAANELQQALGQKVLQLTGATERIFGNEDSQHSLVKKAEQLNLALIRAYDPSQPGSVGDLMARAASFTGTGAAGVQRSLSSVQGGIAEALGEVRSKLIEEAVKDIAKESSRTQVREAGSLIGSVRDLVSISSGANARGFSRGGLSILAGVAPDLTTGGGANLLPKREDIDRLTPLIRQYAEAKIALGQGTLADLRQLTETFQALRDRYRAGDAQARFGSDATAIDDRLEAGQNQVVGLFGQSTLQRGALQQSAVEFGIQRANDAVARFRRRVKLIDSGPGTIEEKVAAFEAEYAEAFDSKVPGSAGDLIQRSKDAVESFKLSLGLTIGPVLRGIRENLAGSSNPADQQVVQSIDQFLLLPEKLDESIATLIDNGTQTAQQATEEFNNQIVRLRSRAIRSDITGFNKQVTSIEKLLQESTDLFNEQFGILSQPGDITDRIAEFASKMSVLDPGDPNSIPSILALATSKTSDVADQMEAARAALESRVSELGDTPEAEGLKAEIDQLLKQPTLLNRAIREALKRMRNAFPDAASTLYGEVAGTTNNATVLRRAGQFFPGFERLLGIAGGGPTAISDRERYGVSPLSIVPGNLTQGDNSQLLPRPQDIAPIGQIATQYMEALVAAGKATRENRADLLAIFDKLRERYDDPATQQSLKLLGIGPEAVEAAKDQIDVITEQIENAYRDMFSTLRAVTDQFAADISGSFKSGLTDAMVAAMSGASDSIGQIFTQLGRAIQQALAAAIIEATIIRGLLNPALNYAFYGSANPTTVNAQGQIVPQPGALPTVGWTATPGRAMGDWFPGSVQVVGAATGMLTKPNTMIRTVEDGLPEAVVPVGRGGIPVRFYGNPRGGNNNQQPSWTIVNMIDPGDIVARGVAQQPGVVVNRVNADLRARGSTARAVKAVANR